MDAFVEAIHSLLERIRSREAKVGIIGLGYVGLPLALASCHAGFRVTGFDIDPRKTDELNAGRSPLKHIGDARVVEASNGNGFSATTDFERLSEMDAIIVCVPTPLGHHREPDLSFVEGTAQTIASHCGPGS